MIENIEGVIENIYSKDVNTRYGQKPVYHAVIDTGHDINLGFKCDYEEGEYVSLDVQNGKYGYELAKTGPGAALTGGAPKAAAPKGGRSAPNVRATGPKATPAFPVQQPHPFCHQ